LPTGPAQCSKALGHIHIFIPLSACVVARTNVAEVLGTAMLNVVYVGHMKCRQIWGSLSGDPENSCLLGRNSVPLVRNSWTFRKEGVALIWRDNQSTLMDYSRRKQQNLSKRREHVAQRHSATSQTTWILSKCCKNLTVRTV